MTRKSDREVLREFIIAKEKPDPGPDLGAYELMLPFVEAIREKRPEINSGWDLLCYCHDWSDDGLADDGGCSGES